jgi:hypothetical protein
MSYPLPPRYVLYTSDDVPDFEAAQTHHGYINVDDWQRTTDH